MMSFAQNGMLFCWSLSPPLLVTARSTRCARIAENRAAVSSANHYIFSAENRFDERFGIERTNRERIIGRYDGYCESVQSIESVERLPQKSSDRSNVDQEIEFEYIDLATRSLFVEKRIQISFRRVSEARKSSRGCHGKE